MSLCMTEGAKRISQGVVGPMKREREGVLVIA